MWNRAKPANRRIFHTLMLAGALACLSGCSLIPKEEEPLQPPLVKPVRENFELMEAMRGTIVKKVSGVATLESSRIKNHEFEGVSGKILEIKAKLNEPVRKGDVLILLDTGDSAITLKERELEYEMAEYNLELAKQTKDPQKMKIRLKELDIARMRLDEAAKAVEGKTLKAQMDGIITFVDNAKPGDTVQPNKTYVTISDPKQVRLAYTASSTNDLLEVQAGMKADVTYRGTILEGTVTQAPANAPNTDNKALAERYAKTLYIELKSVPDNMTLGSSADISVITRKKENAIVVPVRAVTHFMGRTYVKVQDGDSIKEVDVEKGIEAQGQVEIVKGLKEGQKLILQ